MKLKSVRALQEKGFTIEVKHFRRFAGLDDYFQKHSQPERSPESTGGSTLVVITDQNGETGKGRAQCSEKDNYNRKVGICIAAGRAFQDLTKNIANIPVYMQAMNLKRLANLKEQSSDDDSA